MQTRADFDDDDFRRLHAKVTRYRMAPDWGSANRFRRTMHMSVSQADMLCRQHEAAKCGCGYRDGKFHDCLRHRAPIAGTLFALCLGAVKAQPELARALNLLGLVGIPYVRITTPHDVPDP